MYRVPYSQDVSLRVRHKTRQTWQSFVILLAFLVNILGPMPSFADTAGDGPRAVPLLPAPGVMVHLSPEFTPAHLQGITIHPDNALQFDFLIHRGDEPLSESQKRQEYKKLVKYFLASLTIPDEDQWVNLSPYEKDRIIKDDFGKTEMGRDLLAQDYMLKQITSSLIYPEDGLGKKFWDKVYERAWREYHTTNIPVNTFNKVWIIPDQAVVYESGNSAYILKSHLKVMLEQDYLSLEKNTKKDLSFPNASVGNPDIAQTLDPRQKHSGVTEVNNLGSQLIRQLILPELEREVNENKNFANLRQMYSGMILATWYKKALKESLLGKIYADKNKVKGIEVEGGRWKVEGKKSFDLRASTFLNVNQIYQLYLKAFKKGVFNYIKEDLDKYTNQAIPRKYFSGGFIREGVTRGVSDVTVIHQKDPLPAGLDMAALASEDLDKATVAFNARGENPSVADAAMTGEPIKLDPRDWRSSGKVKEINNELEKLQEINPKGYKDVIRVDTPLSSANIDKIDESLRNGPIKVVVGLNKLYIYDVYDTAMLSPEDMGINKNYTILVVEDDPNLRFLTERYLNRRGGFQVETAEDAEQGLEMVGENPGKYLAVFTDYILPNRDGLELARELNEKYPALKVVMHSAENPETFRQKVPLYVVKVLAKPESIEESLGVFNDIRIQAQQNEREKSAAMLSPEDVKKNSEYTLKKPILLVEDESFLRDMFKQLLDDMGGFKVETAENGEQGLDMVKKNPGKYLAVLTDFKMPKKNGLQLANDLNVLDPTLKVVMHSGNVNEIPGQNFPGNIVAVFNKLDSITPSIGIFNDIRIEAQKNEKDKNAAMRSERKGGIDFNAAHLDLQIKRDGRGVPLPWPKQDMAQLSRIQGFEPEIIEIKPAMNVPIISELQQKLHSSI